MNKKYELSIESQSDHLRVHAEGRRTRSTASTLTQDIYKAAAKSRHSKILVDVRELRGRLSVFESLFVVQDEFPKLRGKGIKRAAVVDREPQGMRRWFFETAAQNRGFDLRVFAKEKQALNWLLDR